MSLERVHNSPMSSHPEYNVITPTHQSSNKQGRLKAVVGRCILFVFYRACLRFRTWDIADRVILREDPTASDALPLLTSELTYGARTLDTSLSGCSGCWYGVRRGA